LLDEAVISIADHDRVDIPRRVTPSKLEQDRAAPVNRYFANGFLVAQKFAHDRERTLDLVESELFHSETLFLFRGAVGRGSRTRLCEVGSNLEEIASLAIHEELARVDRPISD
jgi:hypothetical protein